MAAVDLAPFNVILARLEGVADRLERGVIGTSAAPSARAEAATPAAAASADPPIATSFDGFVSEKLPALQQAAKTLSVSDVTEATEMFCTGLSLVRDLLCASGHCCKPKDSDWVKLLVPVLELGQKAQRACDNRSEYFQNRKSVAEALNVMTLVTAASPPTHVQNVLESMDFHAIKVMQKKKDPETTWVKALKTVVKDLKEWCGEQCKLGLVWKPQGQDPFEYFAAHPLGAEPTPAPSKAAAPSSKGKGRGAAPPPPKGGFAAPPPDHLSQQTAGGAANAGEGGMAAVFSAISDFNTANLKKVTSDMKTKNRPKDDAAPSLVPAAAAPKAKAAVKAGKGPRGPPLKELQKELNWVIENFSDTQDLVLDEVEKQQLVCIINCRNVTLQIKSKVKSISIDGCERVNVICHDVISVVELVNCDRCQVQTLGKVNAFAIDKCNGVNLFLSKESLHAEIVTSKSSEMNVTIPEEGGEEGDSVEIPIPEQFVTRIVGPKKLQTEVSSLYSS